MRLGVTDLMKFYDTPLGHCAVKAVFERVNGLWGSLSGLDVLGIGYPGPYLDQINGKPRRLVNMMPAGQGGHAWAPTERGSASLVCDEQDLPFQDSVFDRILVIHGLEEMPNYGRFLREIWRVSAPEAHILIVVPNRSGAWSLSDQTPFGHGRPFSQRQIKRLMRDALLEPAAWTRALYTPPVNWKMFTSASEGWERVGEFFLPNFGGVNLVEGVKRVRIDPTLPERVRVVVPDALKPAISPKSSLRK
ncbi:MAG: methyltransferase type 11 [Ponticaulis sp.]|nr:methyltransferase type 11 [Ponticaulis sp.]|tara:strand:+ start:11355 stop:12098 length:744 start_codon:yes stop_codon:yes gene_type:complete